MFKKSLKITSVSGFNFLSKNLLVFLIFDIFNNNNENLYILILIYIYLQSYLMHSRFTLKRRIGFESFLLFFKLNMTLFLFDYFIFVLINNIFQFVVFSTISISIFIHLIRIILFSKEMK